MQTLSIRRVVWLIIISDKIDFKIKDDIRIQEILLNDKSVESSRRLNNPLNVHAPNKIVSKYMDQKPRESKRKIEKSTYI